MTIKNRQIVVTCDGDRAGDNCPELEIFPENTTTPTIEHALRSVAWTIRGDKQFCSIHGHQAPNRRESDAEDGSSEEEDHGT